MKSKTVGGAKIKLFTKRQIKRGLFMAAMMGPAIVGFLVFYVYVNFNSFIMAFQVNTGETIRFGFDNFAYFMRELSVPGSVFTEAIVNTLIFFSLGFVVMLMSLVAGYFIYKKIVGYKFFRFVFYLPCIVMGTATASLFSFVIARAGPIDDLLRSVGIQIPGFACGSALRKSDVNPLSVDVYARGKYDFISRLYDEYFSRNFRSGKT